MHRPRTSRSLSAALAAGVLMGALLTGCATTPGEPVTSPSERPPLASPTKPLPERTTPGPISPPVSTPATPVPEEIVTRPEVQAAVQAEAERLGVDPVNVTVVAYESITWNDGSLGCPEPGKMYTQALVPGHRLVLSVAGNQASYHAGNAGTFSYCPNPILPASGSSPNA
ncbi:hypothetical protein ET989_01235 [Propioniciclava sinopodophylli]|uniref:PASTA domain-containing protein n=1 Tax=Propioniciclava sinopodophylli TaxID=1837344 RepID=A0A4Q9KH08_9ACTN|nr:hypothetical protein [Propioniciclava sinopodophylli]TBT88605.1 hypothetical protein ET989_01235 [Propioniciclava sinopodophylli]